MMYSVPNAIGQLPGGVRIKRGSCGTVAQARRGFAFLCKLLVGEVLQGLQNFTGGQAREFDFCFELLGPSPRVIVDFPRFQPFQETLKMFQDMAVVLPDGSSEGRSRHAGIGVVPQVGQQA